MPCRFNQALHNPAPPGVLGQFLSVMLAGVPSTSHIDYVRLAAAHAPTSETWDALVRDVLVDQWLAHYARVSDWRTQVLEIAQGS